MPRLLEVALHCQRYNTSPNTFGFDSTDPRLVRDLTACLNVYHAATDRKRAKKKTEWAKKNPAQAELLRSVRQEESKISDPFEVQVEIPTR